MSDLLLFAVEVLNNFKYSTSTFEVEGRSAVGFEDETTLGFVFAYDNVDALCALWRSDIASAAARHSLALRRAGEKAWNVYGVFLGGGSTSEASAVRLSMIEEDLTGTRKIARSGLGDIAAVREALLALLPIQSAPLLEAVNMSVEIRLRSSDLPARAVDAFLGSRDTSAILQVLEEEQ